MTAVAGKIPNLIGGVSQQPPEIRALNCHKLLENTLSDVATGLGTRPAGKFLGVVSPKPLTGHTVATHVINSTRGNYQLSVYGGEIHVTDLDTGLPRVVTVEGFSGDYLSTVTDAAADVGFVTVADTTFIYNRKKAVERQLTSESGASGWAEDGVLRRSPNRYATFWVKQSAGYEAYYSIYVNGSISGSVLTDERQAHVIASLLYDDLTTNGVPATIVSGSSVVNINFASEGDYINSKDDFGDQAIFTYNDSVSEFTDLPNIEMEGRIVLINGSVEDSGEDYWVWYANGRWKETVGWNAKEDIRATTMPQILVHEADGTWTFKATSWPGREVGDADSNPTPSFVGRTIRNMVVHKNRMCILSDENFLASRVGEFEAFYRQTCTQLLDDDPIDIAAANSVGAPMNFFQEFNDELLLFSAFEQFRVTGDSEGPLSPNNVAIKRVNGYANSPKVAPSFIGSNIVFVDDYASRRYCSLMEYQVDKTFGTQVALPITDQVPEYIPSGVFKLIGSTTNKVLIAISDRDRNSLWVYNYYFNSDGKVQSAWQRWTYPGVIYSAEFNRDRLDVSLVYKEDLVILAHTFDGGADTILDQDSILLDFSTTDEDCTANFIEGASHVVLPYPVKNADIPKVTLVVSPENTGPVVPCQVVTGFEYGANDQTIVFRGVNLEGVKFVVGFPYQFRWKPSPIYMRDRDLVAIQDGKLQLRRLGLAYNYSGPFKVHFTPTSRQTYTSAHSGIRVGSGHDLIGRFTLDSGVFRVGVSGEGQTMDLEIEAWTPWRARFSTIEWSGTHRPRKRRV